MLIIESFLHHFISFFGGNSLFDADLSPILGKISPEDGKTMVKECNMDDDYQRIAKHLLQKKKHNNPFLSGMANQLRVVVAVDQDLITTDQESLETLSYREETRDGCEEKGYTYNGGHMAKSDSLNGVLAVLHYSPETAAGNVGKDNCHRIPVDGPGSECIILVARTFQKSCLFEQELEQNEEAVWPKETSQEVKDKEKDIVMGDIFPACLSKGDGTAKDLNKAKNAFVKAMGFEDVVIDGKKVKAMRFAEMMGLIGVIRNLVVMKKHTGKRVPMLAFGSVAKGALINGGKGRSKYVEGCGASHHPESIVLARSRNKANIIESDTNMGKFYGHLLNKGKPMPMTFGMRRFEKKYANGEFLDIDVLKAEAALYMYEQVTYHNRTKEDVLDSMSFELSEHHFLIYEACVRGGETTGDMRTDAAWFMVDQMWINGKTREESLELMENELSEKHRAIYEGCILGGERVGKKRTEAKEFMAKKLAEGVPREVAYKQMESELSDTHVNLHKASYISAAGKRARSAEEAGKDATRSWVCRVCLAEKHPFPSVIVAAQKGVFKTTYQKGLPKLDQVNNIARCDRCNHNGIKTWRHPHWAVLEDGEVKDVESDKMPARLETIPLPSDKALVKSCEKSALDSLLDWFECNQCGTKRITSSSGARQLSCPRCKTKPTSIKIYWKPCDAVPDMP